MTTRIARTAKRLSNMAMIPLWGASTLAILSTSTTPAFAQAGAQTPPTQSPPPQSPPATSPPQTKPAPAAKPIDGERLPDIVVTAERRETNVQDTPLAISAFDARRIADTNITDLRDLAQIAPGLAFVPAVANQNFLQMRGASSGLSRPAPIRRPACSSTTC